MTNNGTLLASAGVLSASKSIAGAGLIEIGSTGTLPLLAGAGSGQMVDFLAGTGLVNLTNPLTFSGTFQNSGAGDQIDLIKTAETSFSYANNTLTVMNGSKTVASLDFAGASNAFTLTSDGHGSTFIGFA